MLRGARYITRNLEGSSKLAAENLLQAFWGGCGRRKQNWHKVCCRGGGGGREFDISEQATCSRNPGGGGGAPPLRGQGWAAATVLQGTGCRVHHRKLEGSNKLAAEHLLQAFGGGLCVVTEIFRGRALVAATVLEGAGYTTEN